MILRIDTETVLRQLVTEDAVDIFKAIDSQRAYLGRWLPFVEYTKVLADTETYVDSVVNAPKSRFEYLFTIRNKDMFAGLVGFKGTDWQNRKTEIGYWLSESFQKQGIMTRAVERLCHFAFHELQLNRVQIKCAVGNEASIAIPIRLGFQFEGIERAGELLTGHVFTDLVVYSKLKSD
jgi:ribosomal-protein-serine acetyltransferase